MGQEIHMDKIHVMIWIAEGKRKDWQGTIGDDLRWLGFCGTRLEDWQWSDMNGKALPNENALMERTK